MSPIPASPPNGRKIGGVDPLVDVVIEDVVVVLPLLLGPPFGAGGGSINIFILGNPARSPALAKLRGFRPADEEAVVEQG